MATVYVSVVCDRHTDPAVAVFHHRDAAIQHCRNEVLQNARFPDDIQEDDTPGEWELLLTYSTEDDYAFVTKAELK